MDNLARDPEIRYTADQRAVASFSVAVNRAWCEADGTEEEDMDDKKSFIAYFEWGHYFKLLPPADVGLLVMAVYEYAETGAEPENISPAALMAFTAIRLTIDRDRLKWEDTCAARAAAGRKGGMAKAQNARAAVKGVEDSGKAGKAMFAKNDSSKSKQTIANVADNDNDNEPEEASPPPLARGACTAHAHQIHRKSLT